MYVLCYLIVDDKIPGKKTSKQTFSRQQRIDFNIFMK
jgi:hypothetical protein